MRFNPLPPSLRTLVSRKPSTIGLRTSAAGARDVRNLCSSLALKVIVVSLHGFIAATWQISARLRSVRLRLLFDAKVSKIVNTVLLSPGWYSVASGMRRSSPLLATCRSTQHARRLRWYGIRCTMNFVGSVEPSLQYGSAPCRGFLLLCD